MLVINAYLIDSLHIKYIQYHLYIYLKTIK
jgi:hypothetical protein